MQYEDDHTSLTSAAVFTQSVMNGTEKSTGNKNRMGNHSSAYSSVIQTIFIVLVAIFNTFGNISVFCTIRRVPRLRRCARNILVASLAVSDFLVLAELIFRLVPVVRLRGSRTSVRYVLRNISDAFIYFRSAPGCRQLRPLRGRNPSIALPFHRHRSQGKGHSSRRLVSAFLFRGDNVRCRRLGFSIECDWVPRPVGNEFFSSSSFPPCTQHASICGLAFLLHDGGLCQDCMDFIPSNSPRGANDSSE